MTVIDITDTEIDDILLSIGVLSPLNNRFHRELRGELSWWHLNRNPQIVATYGGSVELCKYVIDRESYNVTIKTFKDKEQLRRWLKKAQAKGQKKSGRQLSVPMQNVLWKDRWQ